jgi:hypothetical protein
MSGKKRPAAKGGTRVLGRRASGQPAPPRDSPDHRSDQPLVVVTVEPVGHHGQFRGNVGDRVAPQQGSAFLYFGPDVMRFQAVFAKFGIVMVPWHAQTAATAEADE